MRELALFAGAGGGILGGKLLGWTTVCAVEINAYCARRLLQRQNEGHLAPFPVWDDVCTFDGRPWRGVVDVVSGGFPCQDISSIGSRLGISGNQSGLWTEMFRIVTHVQPAWVLIENSQHLRTRGLGRVLRDLDGLGYDTARGVFGAEDCKAPHRRNRMWIVAHTNHEMQRTKSVHVQMAGTQTLKRIHDSNRQHPSKQWWPVDVISGVDDGVANRLDRVRATGNGQVPAVLRLAWETLTTLLTSGHPYAP